MSSVKPVKRSEALLPLSREHHIDLLLAWKIRKGLKNQVDAHRIAAYIRYLDENLVAAHFHDEETLLFDQLPDEDPLCGRARQEHGQIRGMIAEIGEGLAVDPALFNRFADAVEAHVRYEERELFPYLEEKLSAEKLEKIETEISRSHDVFTDRWEDAFWIK
jgi:hemerythrin-like domain-containing protein